MAPDAIDLSLEQWTKVLVCPVCRGDLDPSGGDLVCLSDGLRYPVVDGVPWVTEDRARKIGGGRELPARQNPVDRDDAFVCARCAAEVPPHGRTCRDHCPRCLWSLHVDVTPGDRAASCKALMEPVGVEMKGGRAKLSYRCVGCGHSHRVWSVHDGATPDDWEAIVALSAKAQ